MNYRQTRAHVYLNNIESNVETIINKYNGYKYYFGVVKADSYGHYDIKVVKSIIKGGCNYVAVSSLEEAIEIRKEIKTVPILCLGVILPEYLNICSEENITITIPSFDYIKSLQSMSNIKCHIKLDTGMNRLGIKNKDELVDGYKLILEKGYEVEGIYTHIYEPSNKINVEKQFNRFKEMINLLPVDKIKIIHVAQSETVVNYKMLDYVNGCRIGIAIYGFTTNPTVALKTTFTLTSQVVQIKNVKQGETVGYNGQYKAQENETIGIVAIGYADGIIRANTGRFVYINDKEYQIIGNICMDMLMIKIDDKVKLYDEVDIIKDNDHIKDIANHLNTIPYEIMCTISKRVPRIYNK